MGVTHSGTGAQEGSLSLRRKVPESRSGTVARAHPHPPVFPTGLEQSGDIPRPHDGKRQGDRSSRGTPPTLGGRSKWRSRSHARAGPGAAGPCAAECRPASRLARSPHPCRCWRRSARSDNEERHCRWAGPKRPARRARGVTQKRRVGPGLTEVRGVGDVRRLF